MNKCKRAIYRLDSVSKPFYVCCLYYSKTPKNIGYNKNLESFYLESPENICVKNINAMQNVH